jgi:hypothetical protein
MMRRRLVKSIAGLLVAVGVLMLVGCGGDSNGGSQTNGGDSNGSLQTKAQFTKTVNQMCKQEKEERTQAEQAKQRELGIEPGDLPTSSQHAQIVEASVPFYEKITDQIQELVPADQADEIEPLVEAREKVVVLVRGGSPPNPSLGAIYEANKSALKYGLDECSI